VPSPLERMIDANMACTKCGTKGIGNCHGWEKKPSPKELVKAEVDRVASDIIGHIDTMYSGMWAGAPKTARRSLRGGMINQIMLQATESGGRSRARSWPPEEPTEMYPSHLSG
jgi:hypothetical protein